MLSRAAYRTRQVISALFPGLRDSHLDQARSLLSAGEMELFLSMDKRDQRHGLRVMEHLQSEGQTDRDLLAAALLHDCGKGDVPVWLRIAYVARAAWVESFAESGPGGSRDRAAAYRLVHHVRLGAESAAAAGSSEATVRYISGRAGEHEHAKIASLRAADDRS